MEDKVKTSLLPIVDNMVKDTASQFFTAFLSEKPLCAKTLPEPTSVPAYDKPDFSKVDGEGETGEKQKGDNITDGAASAGVSVSVLGVLFVANMFLQ